MRRSSEHGVARGRWYGTWPQSSPSGVSQAGFGLAWNRLRGTLNSAHTVLPAGVGLTPHRSASSAAIRNPRPAPSVGFALYWNCGGEIAHLDPNVVGQMYGDTMWNPCGTSGPYTTSRGDHECLFHAPFAIEVLIEPVPEPNATSSYRSAKLSRRPVAGRPNRYGDSAANRGSHGFCRVLQVTEYRNRQLRFAPAARLLRYPPAIEPSISTQRAGRQRGR
jgi:hypothetical protein